MRSAVFFGHNFGFKVSKSCEIIWLVDYFCGFGSIGVMR